jgi:hypothetical protein
MLGCCTGLRPDFDSICERYRLRQHIHRRQRHAQRKATASGVMWCYDVWPSCSVYDYWLAIYGTKYKVGQLHTSALVCQTVQRTHRAVLIED